jgi:predicted ArsR family transcriptional regulator
VEILSETEAYRALSSKPRLEILRLLYRKPLSVEEIAQSLKLQPITIRHHLQSLEEAGFIEKSEQRAGVVGRPKTYYMIAKKPKIVSFPRRRYLTLSNFLINTLKFTLGTKKAQKLLKKVGIDMGVNIIKKLELEHNIKEWSPKVYEEFFIKKYLKESGAEPEIVEVSNKKIVYRLHNCLFFEMALKMPEMMCDTLHESFHEGVSKATGNKVKISRATCMAHGDLYCEHACEWRT